MRYLKTQTWFVWYCCMIMSCLTSLDKASGISIKFICIDYDPCYIPVDRQGKLFREKTSFTE